MRRPDKTKREGAVCWRCENEFLDYDQKERVVRCAVCGQQLPLWMLVERLLAEGDGGNEAMENK